MKTIITLSILLLVTISSIVSCNLFLKDHYDLSALLTITSIASIVVAVYFLNQKKTSHL
jgi:hypothetical protein